MGLGVYIIETERVGAAIRRHPRILERVFTEGERKDCEGAVKAGKRSGGKGKGKAAVTIRYAQYLAAKFATMRAIEAQAGQAALRDIEVGHSGRGGKPSISLRGKAAELARQQGVCEMFLSFSYTHSTCVASVVAAREEDIPKLDDEPSAMERLAKQFRDIRGVLDDIDLKLTEIETASEVD